MKDDTVRMAPPDLPLPLALSAARGAGEILRRAFGRGGTVDYKGEGQPVTEADRAADRFLRGILCGERPSYGWLSEESQAEPGGEGEPVWVVDPLDGTVNFIEDRPEFAVCVGLLDRGTPVLGVVYNPMSDEIFSAVRGEPATKDGNAIMASEWPTSSPSLVASWGELDRGDLEGFHDWRIHTVGSTALKMTRVAEGSADLYVSRSRKEIWDVCAGAVIAEAAGATVVDLDGSPLSYSTEFTAVEGMIVVGRSGRRSIPEIVRRAAGDGRARSPQTGSER